MKSEKLLLKTLVKTFNPSVKLTVADVKSRKVLFKNRGFYLTGNESICEREVKEISMLENYMVVYVK